MKVFVSIAATLLVMVAQSAAGSEPSAYTGPREGAVMVYFSKSFGSDQPQNRRPLQFGLRLQQQGLFENRGPVSLLDARYSLGGRQQYFIAGLNAFGSNSESSGNASNGSSVYSSKHPYWTAAMVAAAVIALGCIVEWCDGSEEDDTYSPGE